MKLHAIGSPQPSEAAVEKIEVDRWENEGGHTDEQGESTNELLQ